MKLILDEKQSQKEYLRPLYKLMLDTCQQNSGIIDFQSDIDDIQLNCATILTQMMCLNSRKYYIPGETSENTKMRQKAIQSGILIISTFTYLNSNNDRLKQYFYSELIERLDDEDYQLHFEFEDISFRQFRQIITDQKQFKEFPIVENAPILLIPKSKIQTVNSDGESQNHHGGGL